jgi:DNA-binding NarL/FixJ family response regulator
VHSESSVEPIRVLVVDHNRILRDGICVLIGMQPDLELVGSVAAADDAIRLFDQERPDVTLMDLDLPSSLGVTAICRIREIDPVASVIALATYEWDDCSPRALAAGASNVLGKDQIGEMLLPMIRAGRHNRRRYIQVVHENLLHVPTE